MEKHVIQIKLLNIDASAKKHHICEQDYTWYPAACSCKNIKYLESIIDNSVIMCGEIIVEETKINPKRFNGQK